MSKEELERRELEVAEKLFSKRLDKVEALERAKAAAKAKSKRTDFLAVVLPDMVKNATKEKEMIMNAKRAVSHFTKVKKTTKNLLKRFRPKYSYNELVKEKFLSLAAPKLVNHEALKRKRRFVTRYGAPWQQIAERKRTKYVSRMKRSLRLDAARAAFDKQSYDRVIKLIQHKNSINKDNCFMKNEDDLHLPGK